MWHFTYDADSVKETSEGDVTAALNRLVLEQAAEGGARVNSPDASGKDVSDVTAAAVPGSSAALEDLAIKSLTITDAVATSTDATAVEVSDTDGLSDTAQAFGSSAAGDGAVTVEVSDAGSIGVAAWASESDVAAASEDSTASHDADDVSLEELFAPYAQYGLSFDAKSGTFTYADPADSGARPQHVSVFVSSSETEDVLSNATVYSDGTDDGLKLRAVYDKAGALVGLKEFEGDLGFSLPEE